MEDLETRSQEIVVRKNSSLAAFDQFTVGKTEEQIADLIKAVRDFRFHQDTVDHSIKNMGFCLNIMQKHLGDQFDDFCKKILRIKSKKFLTQLKNMSTVIDLHMTDDKGAVMLDQIDRFDKAGWELIVKNTEEDEFLKRIMETDRKLSKKDLEQILKEIQTRDQAELAVKNEEIAKRDALLAKEKSERDKLEKEMELLKYETKEKERQAQKTIDELVKINEGWQEDLKELQNQPPKVIEVPVETLPPEYESWAGAVHNKKEQHRTVSENIQKAEQEERELNERLEKARELVTNVDKLRDQLSAICSIVPQLNIAAITNNKKTKPIIHECAGMLKSMAEQLESACA